MNRSFISLSQYAEREREEEEGAEAKKKNPVFTLSVSERIIKVASSRGRQTEPV